MANLTVGISDLKVGKAPDIIVTYALGSCVGICLYDKATGVAGMSHIMLPSSKEHSEKNIMKFADLAIPELINQMRRLGANPSRLTAKIAGGAKMFAMASDTLNIGERNVAAVKAKLAELRIPIVAQDTGLNYGRTVFFRPENGQMEVKSALHGSKMF